MFIQVPSIILPTVWHLGTETEIIADLVEHTSIDVPVKALTDKLVYVIATEIITAGVPGPLWLWVEVSPIASTTSAAFYAAIGGGGGALPPLAPVREAPTGVTTTVHNLLLPWGIHSEYARVVAQTPVAATPLTAFWAVQVLVAAKGS